MDTEQKILWPHETVEIQGRKITVSELPWHKALAFLRLLAEKAGKFFKVTDAGEVKGNFTVEQIVDVVTGSEELSKLLILDSTGQDEKFYESLRTSDALTILDKALELNLSEELLKKAGALGRHFAGLVPGAAAKVSLQSTAS